MFVDYFAFVNINKSFINTYRNTELEQLKAVVAEGEETQQELDETQARVESDINTVVYVCMGTKEITNILVYLAVAAYLETKIIRIKTEEDEDAEEKETVKE